MERVSLAKLKARLSAYVEKLRTGDSILILDRGQPVAILSPLQGEEALRANVARLERDGLIKPPTRKFSWSTFDESVRGPLGLRVERDLDSTPQRASKVLR